MKKKNKVPGENITGGLNYMTRGAQRLAQCQALKCMLDLHSLNE